MKGKRSEGKKVFELSTSRNSEGKQSADMIHDHAVLAW